MTSTHARTCTSNILHTMLIIHFHPGRRDLLVPATHCGALTPCIHVFAHKQGELFDIRRQMRYVPMSVSRCAAPMIDINKCYHEIAVSSTCSACCSKRETTQSDFTQQHCSLTSQVAVARVVVLPTSMFDSLLSLQRGVDSQLCLINMTNIS
jgi:hypothetical protein